MTTASRGLRRELYTKDINAICVWPERLRTHRQNRASVSKNLRPTQSRRSTDKNISHITMYENFVGHLACRALAYRAPLPCLYFSCLCGQCTAGSGTLVCPVSVQS